jgi:hypothetical protein
MSNFRDTLLAMKLRAGGNAELQSHEEIIKRAFARAGIQKSAIMGKALNLAARGVEKLPGAALGASKWTWNTLGPGGIMEAYYVQSQAREDADRYARRMNPKFPRKPKGLGVND